MLKKILKILKIIVMGAIAIGAFILVHKVVKKARIGRVARDLQFMPVRGKEDQIQVLSTEGIWTPAILPKGVPFRKVKAAGLSINKNVIVEVKSEKTDRRSIANDPNHKPDPDGFGSGRRISSPDG